MIDMVRELNCVQPILAMSPIAIVEVFEALPDLRRRTGQRHEQALCLAMFTARSKRRQSWFSGNRGLVKGIPGRPERAI